MSVLGSPVGEPVGWGGNKTEGPDAWGSPSAQGGTAFPRACSPHSLLRRCLTVSVSGPRPSEVSRRSRCFWFASSEPLLFPLTLCFHP